MQQQVVNNYHRTVNGRKIAIRFLQGIPLGIMIGTFFTILVSALIAKGEYYPVTPEVINMAGSELNAVILQTFIYAFMGATMSAASLIWDIEEWSLSKQTVLHYLAIILVLLPNAYLLHWLQRSIGGIFLWLGFATVIYLIIWFSIYISIRNKIRKLNENIRSQSRLGKENSF